MYQIQTPHYALRPPVLHSRLSINTQTLDKKVIPKNPIQQICFIPPTPYNHPSFQVPAGFSDPMVKREVGKAYAKSDAAPATVCK
jgi:hypothetical protein